MEDANLIESFLEGDETSFKIIIHRYTDILYGFVRRFGFSPDETADILQEIFIKVWKSLSKFDSEKASFKTWIFTIARNSIYDALRKSKRENITRFKVDENEKEFDVEDNTQDIIELLSKEENKKFISSVLEKLPADYSTIILLHLEEDLTFKEIGEILDKPLDTVKSRYRRALIKLRELMVDLHHFIN